MKRPMQFAAGSLFLALAGAASAVPMISPTGVTGLEVDGGIYDLVIGDRVPNAHFTESMFTPAYQTLANNVSAALLAALNNQSPIPGLNYFSGCSDTTTCILWVPDRWDTVSAGPPIDANLLDFNTVALISGDSAWAVNAGGFGAGLNTSTDTYSQATLVTFERVGTVVTTVPEPTSLTLAGLGIAGLFASRKQRKSMQ